MSQVPVRTARSLTAQSGSRRLRGGTTVRGPEVCVVCAGAVTRRLGRQRSGAHFIPELSALVVYCLKPG